MSKKKYFLSMKLNDNINSSFLMGFYFYENNNNNRVFKIKEMKSNKHRDTGARCIESNKNTIINQINRIVGIELFTPDNTKLVKDAKGNKINDKITRGDLCVFVEMSLRYFESKKQNGERWFLNSDNAMLSNIWNLYINKSNILVDKNVEKQETKNQPNKKIKGKKK
tara:strand:- start:39 stop:539 length:501 start_codon:yes stop_codon:yes gene_type:complete